jgi:hypothetical protein
VGSSGGLARKCRRTVAEERFHAQCSSTFYDDSALFTSVADYSGCTGHDFFEIISLRVAGLKTLWTIPRCQVIGVDCQMAMSAPQPVVLFRQEHELAMIARHHIASHPQEIL